MVYRLPMAKFDTSALRATIVIGGGPDRASVELLDGRSAPLYGVLPWDDLTEVQEELAEALDPVDFVERPDQHLVVDRAEQWGAERLFEALLGGRSQRALRERLIALRGAADGGRDPFQLVIDARVPELTDVPWELLAALPEGHPLAGTQVLRLVAGSQPSQVRGDGMLLEVLLWDPVPDDPISSAQSARIERLVSSLPRVRVVRLPSDLRTLPSPVGDRTARMLHVVCHGRKTAAGVVLENLTGPTSAESAARSLGRLLREVHGVVLDVCGAAASEYSRPMGSPAALFAAAGAPVSIGPRLELTPEAAGCFSEGFYPALAQGATLAAAVAEGRRLIGRLDFPHASGRWWNPVCHLSDLEAASSRCLAPPRLGSWPPGQPACEEVLDRAIDHARSWGYLGVEHIALALASSDHLGRCSMVFRLEEVRLRASLDHLRRREKLPEEPVPTPRLRDLGRALEPGFRLEELAEALLDCRSIRSLLGSSRSAQLRLSLAMEVETVDPKADPVGDTDAGQPVDLDAPGPWTIDAGADEIASSGSWRKPAGMDPSSAGLVLECLGGPDDGLLVELTEAGRVLGRWDRSRPEETDERLYVPPLPENTRVSRSHLVYRGGATVEAGANVRVLRGGGVAPLDLRPADRGDHPPPEVVLRRGDLLLLDVLLEGGGAVLLVLATPPPAEAPGA